jgi:methylmalonyl-CoA epimerase
MFKVTGLNHVGIAVLDLAEASGTFSSKFGLRVSETMDVQSQGLAMRLVETDNCLLELMEPLDPEGTVAKFLEKQKRNAIHHLAFSVDSDLESVSGDLKQLGVEMTYPRARLGVMGHPVNFCHPRFTSNLLIELCDVDFDARLKSTDNERALP